MAYIGTVQKQPVERIDYDVDYVGFLAGEDSLESTAVAVTPVGLVVNGNVVGLRVKVWLSEGLSGITYKVTVTTTTVDGRVKQDEIRVKVKEI